MALTTAEENAKSLSAHIVDTIIKAGQVTDFQRDQIIDTLTKSFVDIYHLGFKDGAFACPYKEDVRKDHEPAKELTEDRVTVEENLPPATVEKVPVKICPNEKCGRQNPVGYTFCSLCGTELKKELVL